MNIKQALKRKNKLTQLINEEFLKAAKYNVIEEGNPRPYSSVESIAKWQNLSNELVQLKTKIHKANLPMYEMIFTLSETKNQIKHLRNLDCSSGISYNRWDPEKPIIKHSEINIVERDGMIKSLEERIEIIQDELDKWNHNTLIED